MSQNLRWRATSTNGVDLRDWHKGPDISEFSNRLGAEGWEIVGFTYPRFTSSDLAQSQDRYMHLIFKRPK
jgi:hypothetical protein